MAGILRVRGKDGVIREIPAFQSGVPFSRTINGKALSADVVLSAADVGASPTNHKHSAADVGAVSAGFGNYGETISGMGSFADESELETKLQEVFSSMKNTEVRRVSFVVSSIGNWAWTGTLFKSSANYATLEVSSGVGSHVSKLTKTLTNGTWTPLEWVNPPMQVGVEYRTTERWNQKAVYTTIVDCGTPRDGKNIHFENINPSAVVRYCGYFYKASDDVTAIPAIYYGMVDDGYMYDMGFGLMVDISHSGPSVTYPVCLGIAMCGWLSIGESGNVKVQVWYTKD